MAASGLRAAKNEKALRQLSLAALLRRCSHITQFLKAINGQAFRLG
jgi:hypothetical protein